MIYTLANEHWNEALSSKEQQESSIENLEKGNLLYLPQLSFDLSEPEKKFLNPDCHQGKSKNISFNVLTGRLKGADLDAENNILLSHMLFRFMKNARHLVKAVLPQYNDSLIIGRTSFRPIEVRGRTTSKRQDDTRLHVDAFTATPNQGKRILRVFSNINPHGESRHWQLGEAFESVLQKFAPKLHAPFPLTSKVLNLLNITKTYRSLYDHYMLLLHDNMKLDDHYQTHVVKQDFHFPSNTSWIVMTDHVSHAALAGQFMLEQTFYLPVSAMKYPEFSPLKILEKHFNRTLV